MSRRSRQKRKARKQAARHDGQALPAVRGDYDAVVDKKRRQPARSATYAEDKHLTPAKRKKLVATARDQQRNFTLTAWAIRKHLDYVSRFSFQARTDDETVNRALEEKLKWWGRRQNCDIARRHSLPRMIRLLEQCRLIDGDVFLSLLRSGHLQPIEGDRVASPRYGDLPGDVDPERFAHGVEVDKHGAAKRYCICKRKDRGGLLFDKWADARFTIQHGYFNRFDQWRGVTPLSGAINTMQDLYENFDLSLVKAKLHNLFGMAITRQPSGEFGDFPTKATGEDATDETERYEVNLQGAPFKLELDPGDDVKFLSSNVPSNEFQTFSEMMIRLALLSCDIPYTFFDVKGSTYSGARQDLLQYYESAKTKREENQSVLNEVTRWKLATWIASGFVALPGSMTLDDVRWEWVPAGLPWIDPKKEIEAYREAVKLGIYSKQRICRIFGHDFFEVADERARENQYESRLGLVPLAAAAQKEENAT